MSPDSESGLKSTYYSGVPQKACIAQEGIISDNRDCVHRIPRTVGGVFLGHVQLAKTEIAKRDMPGVIKQDVLWFQITDK
jgi:hypothetical protein